MDDGIYFAEIFCRRRRADSLSQRVGRLSHAGAAVNLNLARVCGLIRHRKPEDRHVETDEMERVLCAVVGIRSGELRMEEETRSRRFPASFLVEFTTATSHKRGREKEKRESEAVKEKASVRRWGYK